MMQFILLDVTVSFSGSFAKELYERVTPKVMPRFMARERVSAHKLPTQQSRMTCGKGIVIKGAEGREGGRKT